MSVFRSFETDPVSYFGNKPQENLCFLNEENSMMLIAFLVSTPAQWPPTLSQLGDLINLPACSAPCAPIITAQYQAAVAGAAANPGLTCDQVNKNLNKCADKCTEAEFKQVLTAGLPFYMDATVSATQISNLVNTCKTCFPSDAQVTMVDGMPRRLDALRAGDTIVAARADGTLTNDIVSHLSLADADAQGTSFVVLTTESGRNLTLTAMHHVPVGPKCCANLKLAQDIVVGETVFEAVVSATVRATQVIKIGSVIKAGLHSPVLTHGAMPIVDGIVTSFDAMHAVRLATAGLPLLEATGLTATFRDAVLGDRKYIRSHDGYIA